MTNGQSQMTNVHLSIVNFRAKSLSSAILAVSATLNSRLLTFN